MYFVYSLLLAIGFVVLLPRFLFDALTHGKYVAGFGERLGNLPALANSPGRIWIHCVSVGEVQAARPLVSALLRRFPSRSLVVSTTTLTGQRIAREVFRDQAEAVFYFPFDWAWTTRRVLRKLDPTIVVLMETELWPRLLHECRKQAIPVSIVNGRISDTSFRRYQWIPGFIARVLNDLDLALMQSDQDAERICGLGIRRERVVVTGNLKFDSIQDLNEQRLTADFRARFEFGNRERLIIAASTHHPEERFILDALRIIRNKPEQEDIRMVIAPRHPERFSEVAALLNASPLKWTRRTSEPSASDRTCPVVLLDSVGELRALYPLAGIVFVGGSIAPAGGHNVLEPAASGACVVTGTHTSNFAAITTAFLEAGAMIRLPEVSAAQAAGELAGVLSSLLSDHARCRAMGAVAQALCETNRGATDRTIDLLTPALGARDDRKGTARTGVNQPALVSK